MKPWIARREYRNEEETIKFKPGEYWTVYEQGNSEHAKDTVYWSVAEECDEANAHLIAASPDLLEACKAILNGEWLKKDINEVMQIVRVAVAKAEGRE